VCISVARPSDVEGIARFRRRLSAASRRSRLLSAKSGFSVIARDRDAGVVVGQVVVVPASQAIADVAITVADAYEEYQVGSQVLERALIEARRHGLQTFRIDALVHNHRLIDVLTWHGFVPLGQDLERLYLALDGSGQHLVEPEAALR
jgi:N-acetylglutamate synthase-like GNAT family acetyltransferase